MRRKRAIIGRLLFFAAVCSYVWHNVAVNTKEVSQWCVMGVLWNNLSDGLRCLINRHHFSLSVQQFGVRNRLTQRELSGGSTNGLRPVSLPINLATVIKNTFCLPTSCRGFVWGPQPTNIVPSLCLRKHSISVQALCLTSTQYSSTGAMPNGHSVPAHSSHAWYCSCTKYYCSYCKESGQTVYCILHNLTR